MRAIAILGSVALATFLVAAVLLAVRRDGREAGWAFALVVLGVATGILGRAGEGWHAVATALVVSLALRNLTCTSGVPRWLTAAGLATWAVVVILARRLFH